MNHSSKNTNSICLGSLIVPDGKYGCGNAKRRLRRLSSNSRSVGEALANHAHQRPVGAVGVADAKRTRVL
jgi:hypothetical protein